MYKRTDLITTGWVLLIGLLLLAVFHVLILLKVIPIEITWGGQLVDGNQIFLYEIFSLTLTLFFAFIVSLRIDLIKRAGLEKFERLMLKVIFIFFLLNFIANLWSTVAWEKLLFAPLSLLFAILAYRLSGKEIIHGNNEESHFTRTI